MKKLNNLRKERPWYLFNSCLVFSWSVKLKIWISYFYLKKNKLQYVVMIIINQLTITNIQNLRFTSTKTDNASSLTDQIISCNFSLILINHNINNRMWSVFAADGHLPPSGAPLKSREFAHYSISVWWSMLTC